MSDFPEAPPRPNPFYCCAEWHLWRNGLALAIYHKVDDLTRGGKTPYYSDTARLADFFKANKTYVRRMFAALHRAGFLVVDPKDFKKRGDKKHRRWISHAEWEKSHPGKCVVKDELLPWSADADPLVGQLHAAMDGELRLYQDMLVHARSCGRPDKEIVAAVSANWSAAKQKVARKEYARTSVKSVFYDTIKALKV